MKIHTSEKLRADIARKYIEWAEKLSFLHSDSLATARRIRKRQNQESEEVYLRTRPPGDIKVEFLYFRLIEVFYSEDFKHLLQGVSRLFPDLDDMRHGRIAANFASQAGGIIGGGWWNVGYVVREKKNALYSGPLREMSELPEEVEHVIVEIHKPLPSLFVVTLDAHLTNKATEQLTRLQESHYISEVQFRRLVPRGRLGGGYSDSGAEYVMTREILAWLEQLRGKVERCFKPYVNGYFMGQSPDKLARLPAIEVYAFKGTLSTENWMETGRDWMDSMGFGFLGFSAYTDGKLLFVLGREWSHLDRFERSAHRLVVLWEPYLATIKTEMYGGNEKIAIADHTEDVLKAMLPHVSVYEILGFSRKNIEKLRQAVFESMKSGRSLDGRLNKYVKLNDAVLEVSLLLDRIYTEFKQEQKYISHDLGTLADLKRVMKLSGVDSDGLDDALQSSVTYMMELLNKHTALISSWFSQYLTLRNTATTYLLAVVAVVTAVVSIILTLLYR